MARTREAGKPAMVAMSVPSNSAAPAQASVRTERSWRSVRVMITVTLVIATLQFAFGEVSSAVVSYPTNLSSVGPGDIFSALDNAGGPVLVWHAVEGLLLLLAALGTTAMAVRYRKRSLSATSILGLVSALIAVGGGYIWVSSGFNNGGGILLMVNGAVGIYAFYFLSLYYTK